MEKKKEDRRVKYTKMVLKNSLIDLLETKNIAKITIKELCEHADVNRATFYAHYSDQHDLLISIEEEYIEKIFTDIQQKNPNKEDTVNLTEGILNFIYDNAKMSRILLSDRGDINFQKRIMSLVHKDMRAKMILNSTNDKEEADLISAFIISGCIGIIQKWFENDFNKSPIEIAEVITHLALTNLNP